MLTASQEADGPQYTSPLGICNTPDPNLRALSLTPTQQRSPSRKQRTAGWGSPRGGAVGGTWLTPWSQTWITGLRGEVASPEGA